MHNCVTDTPYSSCFDDDKKGANSHGIVGTLDHACVTRCLTALPLQPHACWPMQEGIEQGWFRKPQTLAILAGAPDLDGILRTAIEIVDALCYLHKANVLHGDLTGNNILLASSEADDRRFTVKVSELVIVQWHVRASGVHLHSPFATMMDIFATTACQCTCNLVIHQCNTFPILRTNRGPTDNPSIQLKS